MWRDKGGQHTFAGSGVGMEGVLGAEVAGLASGAAAVAFAIGVWVVARAGMAAAVDTGTSGVGVKRAVGCGEEAS